MFIIFEGIDGSGKTTLSNRVAERLRALGLSVAHAREGGTFASPAAQAIRELGRDARNLMLSPLSELMIYAARDGQSLEEIVVPALAEADIVLADRHLESAELLATVRGVPPDAIAAVLAPLRARARADLAILVDVDPDLARARRRVAKQLANERRPPSRKGLTGAGLQLALRRAHRTLAERDPGRWLIVDNDDTNLDEAVAAIASAIATAARAGVAAGLASARARLRAATPLTHAATPSEARAALLAWSVVRAEREPAVAAYVLAGLSGAAVDAQRRDLAARAPDTVAASLTGLADAASDQLRADLATRAPDAVARSLIGQTGAHAWALRDALIAAAPEAVAFSLTGLDDDRAWHARDVLADAAPDAVAASLARVSSPRADDLRRRRGAPTHYLEARATARMTTGCGDELGWQLRRAAWSLAPVEAIASLEGVVDDEAWRWRARYAARAPRPVADSLSGMIAPAADHLRDALADRCRETVDTIFEQEGAAPWALRERLADLWPASVCGSLGALSATARGVALVRTVLASHRGLRLWRNVARYHVG